MSAVSGVKLRRVVVWIGAALFGAAVLSAHVYKQNLYVRLSRDAQRLEQEMRKRQNELAALEIDVKGLMRRQRLEDLAVKHFGLAYAGAPERVVGGYDKTPHGLAQGEAMAMASADGAHGNGGGWVRETVKWLTTGL